MELVLIWLASAVLAAIAADSRGRSGFGWFLLGLLFGFFALIAVLVMPRYDLRSQPVISREADRISLAPGADSPMPRVPEKTCPACFAKIDARATRCRFCAAEQPAPTKRRSPYCPTCRRMVAPDARVCPKCDTVLEG